MSEKRSRVDAATTIKPSVLESREPSYGPVHLPPAAAGPTAGEEEDIATRETFRSLHGPYSPERYQRLCNSLGAGSVAEAITCSSCEGCRGIQKAGRVEPIAAWCSCDLACKCRHIVRNSRSAGVTNFAFGASATNTTTSAACAASASPASGSASASSARQQSSLKARCTLTGCKRPSAQSDRSATDAISDFQHFDNPSLYIEHYREQRGKGAPIPSAAQHPVRETIAPRGQSIRYVCTDR